MRLKHEDAFEARPLTSSRIKIGPPNSEGWRTNLMNKEKIE